MSDDSLELEPTQHGPKQHGPTRRGLEARVTSAWIAPFVIAFLMSAMLSAWTLAICGASLALFLGGFFFVTILLPPLMLTQETCKRRLLLAGCVVDGVGVVWLLAVLHPQITFIQWLRCYLLLLAWGMWLSGLVIGLAGLRMQPTAASAAAVILSLVWLTWPVWLSSYLTGPGADRVASWLIRLHPLFAVNGVFPELGVWSHWPIAYRDLTTLGQDIAYTLPTSVWPAIAVHVIPGVVLAWLGLSRAKTARV